MIKTTRTRDELSALSAGLPETCKSLDAHWRNGDVRNIKAKIAKVRAVLDALERQIKEDLYNNL